MEKSSSAKRKTGSTKSASKKSRARQQALLKREESAYGGDLLTTRRGRSKARPLATRETMHLVLRSTKAKGDLSFLRPKHDASVRRILAKFALKYGVTILSIGNAGNHIHLQMKLASRFTYNSFIRAVTGAIAMAVTGRNRWTKRAAMAGSSVGEPKNISSAVDSGEITIGGKFWDRRPFTRIVKSFKGFTNVRDYVRMNELEGMGFSRKEARQMVDAEKMFQDGSA